MGNVAMSPVPGSGLPRFLVADGDARLLALVEISQAGRIMVRHRIAYAGSQAESLTDEEAAEPTHIETDP